MTDVLHRLKTVLADRYAIERELGSGGMASSWRGAYRVEGLARIYTMVGEYDAAIDHLENLLSVPSFTAVPMLRIDPTSNPLRDHPRFQALLAKYEN